jgi:hypothetical protein
MNSPMKNMAYWKGKNNPTPAKQTNENLNDAARIAAAKEEEIAQQSKAEHEGQQIIGQVDRGEVSLLEGNKSLSDLQNLQNTPQ